MPPEILSVFSGPSEPRVLPPAPGVATFPFGRPAVSPLGDFGQSTAGQAYLPHTESPQIEYQNAAAIGPMAPHFFLSSRNWRSLPTYAPASVTIQSATTSNLGGEWQEFFGRFLYLWQGASLGASVSASLIYSLVEHDKIQEARRLLERLPQDDSGLVAFREILAPARVTVVKFRDSDRAREYQWLREHRNEYQGKWVALEGNHLLHAAEALTDLLRRIRELKLEKKPFIHRLPSPKNA